MKIDSVLKGIQVLSLVAFMISVLFIATTPELLKYTAMAVLSLYIFMGVSYVNHARNNGINNSIVTKQVASIVLGTIILIIVITVLFRVAAAMNVIN